MRRIYAFGFVGLVVLVLITAMATAVLCEDDTFGVYNETKKLEERGIEKLTEAEKEYYKNIKKLEWAGPEGTAPTPYDEWSGKFPAPIPPGKITLIERVDLPYEPMSEIGTLHPSLTHPSGELIITPQSIKYLALLNGDLWGNNPDLQEKIYRWVDDIYLQTGRTMEVWRCHPTCSKEYIRNWLNDQHFNYGAGGCVIIGDQDVPWYEIPGHTDIYGSWWNAEEFPIDLYYMDLDGTWTDSDSNGKFDAHTGDVEPEIWIGRLTASPLTTCGSEAELLKNYFDKNHIYRGSSTLDDRALAYIYKDWANGNWDIDDAYPSYTLVDDSSVVGENDYRNRIKTGNYEFVHVMVHSWSGGHDWKPGYYYSSELCSDDPQPHFYNLFACSNARYVDGNYMGGTYIFTPTAGLVAVGSTKTGSMLQFGDFYSKLGSGWDFGESYLYWFDQRASGGFASIEKDWHYGMTLLGDPTLKLSRYMKRGYTYDSPALTSCSDGSVHLAVRGTDNGVWYNRRDPNTGNWGGWELVQSGYTSDSPALTSIGNSVHLAVRGYGDGVWYNRRDPNTGNWDGWEHVQGGYTTDSPALTFTSLDGYLHLAVRGLDGGVWYNHRDPSSGWDGWLLVQSGYTYNSPALASECGYVYVAVRGTDGGVWWNKRDLSTGNWSGWVHGSGYTKDAPAFSDTPGMGFLAVRGLDDGVWIMWGSSWEHVQNGYTYNSPALTYTFIDGYLHLAVRGTDNGVWYNRRDPSSGWDGWVHV